MNTPFLSRRRFLQMLGGLGLAGATGFGYVRLLEPNWVDVEQVSLAIANLPTDLVGLRFAQISDIHLSDYTSPAHLVSAVEIVNRLAPAFVMATGDYVGDRADDAAGLVEPLQALAAPLYAIYGNHDLWTNRGTVGRYLEAAGARLLVNEAVEVVGGLTLAGLDDLWSGTPDLEAALRNLPHGQTTLLMVHEPDFFDRVLAMNAPVAVQFSGHSHGGQVRIPALGRADAGKHSRAPVLPRYGQRYPIGLQRVGERQVYTNRGLGVWPLPYRFNCRPEITLFTLERRV